MAEDEALDNSNVASMHQSSNINDEDDFDKFRSSLGKRNLEDFVSEKTTSSKRVSPDQLMPFLSVENYNENATTTEGILPLINILEFPQTRTCGRSRENGTAISLLPLLHIQQKDKWSCGYRNLQMLLSALIPQLTSSDHPYHSRVPASLKRSDLGVAVPIPSLMNLQEFLESAWQIGLDPRGCEHYGGKIVGKEDEIGAVEVSSILGFLRIDNVVVQFIKTPESRRLLSPFIWSYFGKRSGCDCVEPLHSVSTAEDLLEYAESLPKEEVESKMCTCPSFPLYLQWEGHSVSVIGIRKIEGDTDYELLVLDPAKDGNAIHRLLSRAFELDATVDALKPLIMGLKDIADKDCQVVMATKRPIVDTEIVKMKERVSAVTAARESVVKLMGMDSSETATAAEK
jgi:hypothetical protein